MPIVASTLPIGTDPITAKYIQHKDPFDDFMMMDFWPTKGGGMKSMTLRKTKLTQQTML